MTDHMSPILPDPERELSYGESMVLLDDNPASDPAVYAEKAQAAHVLDAWKRGEVRIED